MMPPTPTSGETLNQQIDSLRQTVLNLQALADRARQKGQFDEAQSLSTQATALGMALNDLNDKRRGQAFSSDAWAQLSAHLEALNAQAKDTQEQMQTAEDNVETVKTVIGLVSKVAGGLL